MGWGVLCAPILREGWDAGVLSSAGLGPLEMEDNQGQGQVRVKVTTTPHSIQQDSLRWEGLGCGQNT